MATPKEQVEQFLKDTDLARRLSQKCRDYYDSKQWTEEEAQKLESRRQAAIVVNRIRPKVEGLVGLYDLRKSDPKAYPRTTKHEKASHVITDALRFVCDNNSFEMTRLDVAEEFFIEGYAGVFTGVKQTPRGIEILINHIPWDRIYFDPHSRKKDFKDARFMGMWLWMDEDQAMDTFNLSKAKVDSIIDAPTDGEETNADRPRWYDNQGRRRLRIAMHFSIKKGKWRLTVFSGDTIIKKEQDSPFLDEDGLPMNPIELVSANIDRDNNRYGEVAGFISQQDEINHRRSKFLHFNSTRQTFGNSTAVTDVDAVKKELKKPDGHIQLEAGAKLGEDFGILPNNDLSQAQFNLYLDAKSELDSTSFNSGLAGDSKQAELSGKAIGKLQESGTIELNRQYSLLKGWEKRVYEQVWFRVKQFWNEEKWIRVTDDQDDLRWVGLNAEVTAQTLLMENIQDDSLPLQARQQSEQILQLLMETENPRLNEIVETRNPTTELDVDIIIDQSLDVINIQQEQFELIATFAQKGDIDVIELIELSQLRGKDDLIKKLEKRRAEQAQAQQATQQEQMEVVKAETGAKIEKTQAQTRELDSKALKNQIASITQQLENQAIQANPDPNPQISV
jgi:hypothetical protein